MYTNKELYTLWDEFVTSLFYRNRFFVKNDAFLRCLDDVIVDNTIRVSMSTKFYRARIYTEDVSFIEDYKKIKNIVSHSRTPEDAAIMEIKKIISDSKLKKKRDWFTRKESNFWGYESDDSFVPPNSDRIADGRANPSKICYLYMADDAVVALSEIRPFLDDYVSVAEIVSTDELTLVDFSNDALKRGDNISMLVYLIMDEFSKPNNNDSIKYLPSQYISEYIKSKGYDGIKYNSSMYKPGHNFVIFNYEKCQPISSRLYKIGDICYDATGVAPFSNDIYDYSYDLFHKKLEPQKRLEKEELRKLVAAYNEFQKNLSSKLARPSAKTK